MGEGGRIDDDEGNPVAAGAVDRVYQLMLGVALEELYSVAEGVGQAAQALLDLRQVNPPVVPRFPGAEKVQVGTVEHKNGGHLSKTGVMFDPS
jgi:hypothetical protein